MLMNRPRVSRARWLTALAALGVVLACGSTKTGGGTGGNAGNGAESGWTYLPPGSSTGGSGLSAGNSSGGALGHAGNVSSAGAGGTVMLPPVTFKCGGTQPNQPVITSFDAFTLDRWTSPGNLNGGVYVYPEPLKPTAGDFLRFAGLVNDYTGMGVWFNGCIDASKFRGVRFTISGNVGTTGKLQFYVISNRDKEVVEEDGVGACVPVDPAASWNTCRPPVVSLPVTAQPATLSVPWSDFTGGLPSDKTDGSDVIALQWSFNWDAADVPYTADLTVDDVAFYNDETGAGGAGGAPPDGGNEGGVPAMSGSGGQGGP